MVKLFSTTGLHSPPLFPIGGFAIKWDFEKEGLENMPSFWGGLSKKGVAFSRGLARYMTRYNNDAKPLG